MKIQAVYLKPESNGKFPGDPSPVSVLRAKTPDGKPNYDITFEAGFYICRKNGAMFRIPAHNVKYDEPMPAEEKKAAKVAAA